MRVIDRLTGKAIKKLPDILISGRYQTLELLQFNGHSELTSGDLFVDDGSGGFRDGDHEYKFLASEQSDDVAETELATDAIITIANKITHAAKKTISPMLPSELAVQYELEQLEKELTNVLKKGHLQAISDRPRRDLRYDDIVTPVARARRLATSAISHLASHSDCWQQRTLSGLLPRKVLARFSEDDYAIYENRLYKRMLDRLEKYLSRRLARIKAVMTQLEKALDFQNSEQTHHDLIKRICTLWGEVYQTDNTSEQLSANRKTIEDLTSLLRQICGLKQRGLYNLIPINANVPEQVHRTNILNHDPHYRHIPPLWEKICDCKENQQLTPKQHFERQKELHLAYSAYVGLVIRRALERYNLSEQKDNFSFNWATQKIVLQQEQYDWLLNSENGKSLKIVPIAWYGQFTENSADITNIICYPGVSNINNESQNISISPLDLYVVERMGSLIDEWLIKQLVTSYAKPLCRIPAGLKSLTDKWTEQFESDPNTNDVKLITPLNEEQNLAVKNTLRGTNDSFRKSIDLAIAELTALSQLCGHKVKLIYSPPNDFFCECDKCSSTWFVRTMPNQVRKFSIKPKSDSDSKNSFAWAGRNWLEFEISV